MGRSAANLKGWLKEPRIKNAVVAFLKAAEYPMLMREVSEGCATQVSSANRVLLRLHKSGQVARHKLPIMRHAFCRKTMACVPHGATRMLYVYSWVDS